jgi:2-oxoglutarate ferredoxin oxidoreductase subunit gamma
VVNRKKGKKVSTILLAGFGGQGVLSMGQFLAYAGMLEGKEVSWVPAYGPEMRGGTANCLITIADEEIDSPVFEFPDAVIAMNRPSLDKFEKKVGSGGILITNSSMIDRKVEREDLQLIEIPANELANSLGNIKVANMIMVGALLELTGIVRVDSVLECLQKVLSNSNEKLITINRRALELGAECVQLRDEKQRLAV